MASENSDILYLNMKLSSSHTAPKPPSDAAQLLSSSIDLFVGISSGTLGKLGRASQLLELPPLHFLFRADDAIHCAYFLVSGSIKRGKTVVGGREKVIELVHPRQMFAIGELFSTDTYTSFAETLSPCVVIGIDAEVFRNQIFHDLELSSRMVKLLAQRQCAIEFEVVQHHASVGSQRVLDYLMEMAGDRLGMAGETTVHLEPSKKLIAARLGMAPESFSRTLHQLAESGAIVVEGRTVHIQNAALAVKGNSNRVAPMHFSRKVRTPVCEQTPHISPSALINLCGRQRFLSQLMAISWAMIGRKFAPRAARVELRQYGDKFDRILDRLDSLWFDDAEKKLLDRLRELWPAYHALLMNQPPVILQASKVFELSEDVLDAADQLTYAAEMRAASIDGHRVNTAGRNRMLSARLTKLFLFRDWQVCEEEARARMERSRREFEANLAELSAGCSDVPEVVAQLHVVGEHWQKFTTAIDIIPEYKRKRANVSAVLAASEALLRHVDTTVKMYERMAE